jgi:hypothetical protein
MLEQTRERRKQAFHPINQRGRVVSKVNAVSRNAHLGQLLAIGLCFWPAGTNAQPPNPTGTDNYGNTAGGDSALLNVTSTGYTNTAFGGYALYQNTTGDDNTASGHQALLSNTTGSSNTANGRAALQSNKSGSSNTATGYLALQQNVDGSGNTATGHQAMLSNVSGGYNSAVGMNALYSNTSGYYNTASGLNALFSNTTGGYNTASGVDALFSNTIGGYNTASGGYALYNSTTGSENTAFGYQALNKTTTGGDNTAAGVNALYANTTGKQNTAFGVNALHANTTGTNNVAVGFGALRALAGNGSGNIALGAGAGSAAKAGNNNIYIGSPGGSESRVTRIGTVQTKAFIAGVKGVPLSGATVVVNSSGQLGVVASSARYKRDIAPLTDAAAKLAQLRPVSYRYKAEPDATHYGLIAEEVDKVMPELVVRDEENRPESVQYQELIPLLLKDRQELRAELARQRALIEQQAATLAALRRTLDARFAALDR